MIKSFQIVRFIHMLLLIYIIFGPFLIMNRSLLQLYIVSVISILIHWYFNNNVCVLTMVEKYLTNDYSDSTFISSIISPVYKKRGLNETCLTYILLFIAIIKYIKLFGFTIK